MWVGVCVWAMLVPDCILLFTAFCCFLCCAMILVEKNGRRYMDSQPHRRLFNMDPCRACEEKWLSHIETGAGK